MESLLPLLLIFAVMMLPMFWISSRQRKMQRQQLELVSQLGIGDEVRTHSGFYGLIIEELGDQVILESENGAQTKWDRRAIAGAAASADMAGVVGSDDITAERDQDRAAAGDLDPALSGTDRAAQTDATSGDFAASYDGDDRREGTLGTSEGDWYDQDRRDR